MSSKNAGVALVARFMGRQNTIPVPVPFIDLLGDMTAAAFLSQCLYWDSRTDDPDGWFFKTHADWHEELRLSADQVRRCSKTCVDFIETRRGGVTGRMHYRVLHEPLEVALQMLGNPTTRCGQTQQLDVGKPNNQMSGNPTTSRGQTQQHSIYTKTTAEITAERSAAAAASGNQQGQNQSGASRAAAPNGAGRGTVEPVQDQTQITGSQNGQSHGQEDFPGAARPGEKALRSTMGDKLYNECLDEDPDRQAWADLTPARISELRKAAKAEAEEKHLPKWRTPFIALLDREIRPQATQAAAQPTVDDIVRARLQGNKP